jgi:hypothetical protein
LFDYEFGLMIDKERGILLVYNNKSGTGRSVEPASKAALYLSNIGHPYDLIRFTEFRRTPHLLDEAAVVGVYGGDGTVYSVAKMIGKSDRKPTLLPVPTGTENILANSIHGRINPDVLIHRVIDTLNGGSKPLNVIQLEAGEYTAGDSHAENMFWLLTAGDSGITRRTLTVLNDHQEKSRLNKNLAILRTSLTKTHPVNTVLITVFDRFGEKMDEFDALEASVVKKTPGRWSRAKIVPHDEKPQDQIFTIGRGHTNYNSSRFAYRTLYESLGAMTGIEVGLYDREKRKNPLLTRLPLSGDETVIFTSMGNSPFNGVVADSEIQNGASFNSIRVLPTVSEPIVNVFTARHFNND